MMKLIRLLSLASALAVIGIAPSQASIVDPTCSYASSNLNIVNQPCKVQREGSLDSKYKGNITNIPGKITVTWQDGVKTSIVFDSLDSIGGRGNGITHTGVAFVDGKSHTFSQFRGLCFTFNRLAEDLSEKQIRICD
jgi:hypothetical protein